MSVDTHFRYWGKAGQGENSVDASGACHPLVYHSLDVAAVGCRYLAHHQALCAQWSARLVLPRERLTAWIAFFLALHDLGKFSYRFQYLQPDLCRLLGNEQRAGDYTVRHDTLGQFLLEQAIVPAALGQAWFGTCRSGSEEEVWSANLQAWGRTVTGHHGQPPNTIERVFLDDHFSTRDRDAAMLFAKDCAALFLPDAPGELPDGEAFEPVLQDLSWWLAGLSVLSDWVGSNADWFRYRVEPMALRDYWADYAHPQAEEALQRIGLQPRSVRPQSLASLFGYLERPTPLQLAASELPLDDSPNLLILEDVTGAGKTEAALILAHRAIAHGDADGFYFGLPTMATSNAMFRRLKSHGLPERFFQDPPSVVLAHSASLLGPVLESLFAREISGDADYARHDASASSERTAWFADSRKKALLADIGVGTVDQALLAVLYSRHQSLRLLGLARKVLIVDEVHACDAYMSRLLEVLLTFHARAGGSAILLSATLPGKTRQRFVDAFCKGLGRQAPLLQSPAYPLLTQVAPSRQQEIPLDTRPEVARSVQTNGIHSEERVVELLLAARREGRCACWIRNTVDDAIEAYEKLRGAGIPDDELMLFHARFALVDRMRIEGQILELFGPTGGQAQRSGKILIATQVVEQSLDLDFDVMVSDLAPVDLLIQRAGRLCRHCRGRRGNPASVEERGVPCLWVYGPAFTEEPEADWFSGVLPGAAAVYPNHGEIWLTARLVEKERAIVMPETARRLIEGVYGDAAEADIPPALRFRVNKSAGTKSAKQSMASANAIRFGCGYECRGYDPWDEARIPTRLEDQPSVTVRLARRESGALTAWHDADNRYAWELSQLSVRWSLFADELPDSVDQSLLDDCRKTMPDQGRWSKLLVLQRQNDLWVGQARNGKGESVTLCYDHLRGLRRAELIQGHGDDGLR